jgi:hypothetical protein
MTRADLGALPVRGHATGVDAVPTRGTRTVHAVVPDAAADDSGLVRAVCGRLVRPADDSWPPSGSRPEIRACHDCAARLLDPGTVPGPR